MKNSDKSFRLIAPTALMLSIGLGLHADSWAQAVASAGREPTAAAQQQALSLKELVEQVRVHNKAIRSKQAESKITATGVERAAGAFQRTASINTTRGMSSTKNTFEEDLVRQGQGVYERTANDYSAGISQLLPSGGKLEVKTSLSRFISNINNQTTPRPPGLMDNRSQFGFTLTQPLARDAGKEVTSARLNVAKLDASAAELTARDTETSVVAEATIYYHELTFAHYRVQAAQERIRNAQRLLQEAQAMKRGGRLPDTDVWEVENALGRYQAGLGEALQQEREKTNRLRTMLMTVSANEPRSLRTTDALPEVGLTQISQEDSLRTALERRDDFLMRKVQVEREGVQVSYSKNQMLPRVDLVTGYGVGALEYSYRKALTASNAVDYPTWSVGLQLSFPLGPNRQAKADVEAAVVRREDAMLALEALQVQIANDIDTSLAMLQSSAENWQLWKDVHEREKKQLEAERRKFSGGRSDTREVLLREERVINSMLNVREQQLAHARAQVMLQSAQGTLLDRFR